jgi:hypothetical protein
VTKTYLFSSTWTAKFGCWLVTFLLCCSPALAHGQTGRLRFQIRLAPELGVGVQSGRLIVFLSAGSEPQQELKREPGEALHSMWIAAEEIRNLQPGQTVDFDPDRLAWPTGFSNAPRGNYQAMAVLDVNHHYAYNGLNPGDLRSRVLQIKDLDPRRTSSIELVLAERIDAAQIKLPSGSELLDFTSPLLSKFWGRPIHIRGIVVLPPNYSLSVRRYPAVFAVGGFTLDLVQLASWAPSSLGKGMAERLFPEMIHVVLDESCPGGTHEFADSVNNGPWGRALTEELVPYLESKYRMIGKPGGRLVWGGSSGGWAVLWLQVNYPGTFGGAWVIAPDSPDFRNFYGANLYANPPENLYRVADGKTRAQWVQDWAQQDRVLGDYGSQWTSFEWVFSPRGDDGRPQPLFDRDSGAIDATVAKAWQVYDIAGIIRRNADRLRPLLAGKIHLTVGAADAFGPSADHLLEETLKEARIGTSFAYLPGRGHFDVDAGGWMPVHGGLLEQIFLEMDAVARR